MAVTPTFTPPSVDPDDLYVQDRLLAVSRFDPVEFARTFEHRRVHVDGLNLHYVVGGRGPLIVFGHGWPASWYEWRKVMPLLADRFTCLAFDLPGCGDSGARRRSTPTRSPASSTGSSPSTSGSGRSSSSGTT